MRRWQSDVSASIHKRGKGGPATHLLAGCFRKSPLASHDQSRLGLRTIRCQANPAEPGSLQKSSSSASPPDQTPLQSSTPRTIRKTRSANTVPIATARQDILAEQSPAQEGPPDPQLFRLVIPSVGQSHLPHPTWPIRRFSAQMKAQASEGPYPLPLSCRTDPKACLPAPTWTRVRVLQSVSPNRRT
jgi:hypothetical protein